MAEEHEISYMALEEGTPIQSATGKVWGEVVHVLQIPSEDLFDGVVVTSEEGLRFVDRDQIGKITTSAVHCLLSDEQMSDLPMPEGTPVYHVDALRDVGPSLTAHLGRLFRRGRWVEDDN